MVMATNKIQWSSQQNTIFEWFANPTADARNLIVRARAGTGKTTTIIEGISRAPEDKILLAAFNKSIAKELSARVSNNADVKTLHALGFALIRKNWNVRVDTDRAIDLAKRALSKFGGVPWAITSLVRKLHTQGRELAPGVLALEYSDAINRLVRIAEQFDLQPSDEHADWDTRKCAAVALDAMRLAAQKTAIIDFADMIFLPLVHGWVDPKYQLVVVDEAQDMTATQLELAQKSVDPKGRICVVGDNFQAIYAFRGADSGSLDRLKSDLAAKELGLTITYRCPKNVVELAKKIVADFTAHDHAPLGEISTVSADKMVDQAAVGDFVLSRTNAPLVRTCLDLIKSGKPARIRGRDIGKGLKAIIKQLKATSVDNLLDKLEDWSTKQIVNAIRKIKNDDVLANKIGEIHDQHDVLVALTERLPSPATLDTLNTRLDKIFAENNMDKIITCSTVHRVKGLESDHVWILADTFKMSGNEENNIKYVAITRTKRALTWVVGVDA